MSEPLYRIDLVAMDDLDRDAKYRMMERGVLVPVERCEHGNIDGHWFVGYGTQTITDGIDGPEVARIENHPGEYWCPGAGIGGDDET